MIEKESPKVWLAVALLALKQIDKDDFEVSSQPRLIMAKACVKGLIMLSDKT